MLLLDVDLEQSAIVANNAMNRERGLAGVNSYERCLGFNPLDRVPPGGAWLDLCCGSGRALVEAAAARSDARLVGVDLVDYFEATVGRPTLICASLSTWRPDLAMPLFGDAYGRSGGLECPKFDLITCVHGLHYAGDKLGLLARITGWLALGGTFAADFDVTSIRGVGLSQVTRALRRAGFTYDGRRHRITYRGGSRVEPLPFTYLGADDQAGPNYTGQPAVDSHYRAQA